MRWSEHCPGKQVDVASQPRVRHHAHAGRRRYEAEEEREKQRTTADDGGPTQQFAKEANSGIEGTHLDGDTDLQTIAETSPGIEGWALHDFGTENTMNLHGHRTASAASGRERE